MSYSSVPKRLKNMPQRPPLETFLHKSDASEPVFDLYKVKVHINKVYRVDLDDYLRWDSCFTNWHKGKGYPQTDSEGKHYRSSQIWFAEYQNDVLNGYPEPAALCFWRWLRQQVDIEKNIPFAVDLTPRKELETPWWVVQILTMLQQEFPEITGHMVFNADW